MFTIRDTNTGEFVFWSYDTESFIFSYTCWTVKDNYERAMQFLQFVAEFFPKQIGGRKLGVYEIRVAGDPTAVYQA